MKIAIIVWGSLYWDPRELAKTEDWFYDGPVLPLEYARKSNNGRITLVIKPDFDDVTTLYAISSLNKLDDAIDNLRIREDTDNVENIGYVDYTANQSNNVRQSNSFIINRLNEWNSTKSFDAIIWSDFSAKFKNAGLGVLSVNNIVRHINSLDYNAKADALEYISKTPKQISTRFRSELEKQFNLTD